MRMKLSGLPLCKAGDWGLQTSEKCFCSGFFAASPQKGSTTKHRGRDFTVGCVRFSTSSKNAHTPPEWGCEGTQVPSQPPGATALRILHDILWCYPQKNQNKKGPGAAPQWEISVSFMRLGPQQVSPVLCAACARQKIHAAACQGFPIGYVVCRDVARNVSTNDIPHQNGEREGTWFPHTPAGDTH